jgi:acyl-CoA synthetase (AMP-forming)/AMP-acid ligase II
LVALLAYTSGTAGRPKGVPLTHRQLTVSIRVAMAAWRWQADDVLVHALPLYHQHGLGGVHAALIAGGTVHTRSKFSAESLVQAAVGTRASVLFAVPAIYQALTPATRGARAAAHDQLRRSGIESDVARGFLRDAVSGRDRIPHLHEYLLGRVGLLAGAERGVVGA